MRKIAMLVGVVALMSVVVASVALAAGQRNGTPDAIYGRSGRDVLRADEHTRDTDRLYGNRGRDKLNVLDGETRDKASGGPGCDTCYIDSSREIGPSCEVLVVS